MVYKDKKWCTAKGGSLKNILSFYMNLGLPSIIRNVTFDNRLPPDGYRVDHAAMNRD